LPPFLACRIIAAGGLPFFILGAFGLAFILKKLLVESKVIAVPNSSPSGGLVPGKWAPFPVS
jgi:hypothetical protein